LYEPGDAATHHGSLWICRASGATEPGVDFAGWQLRGQTRARWTGRPVTLDEALARAAQRFDDITEGLLIDLADNLVVWAWGGRPRD
jgi:hypothetical protein